MSQNETAKPARPQSNDAGRQSNPKEADNSAAEQGDRSNVRAAASDGAPPDPPTSPAHLDRLDSGSRQRALQNLQIQRGNQYVQRLVAQRRASAGLQRSPAEQVVQRQGVPQASYPPPQASTMPSGTAKVVIHEGVTLAADSKYLRNILEQKVPKAGLSETSSWAYRFINLTTEQKIAKAVNNDLKLVEDIQVYLKEEIMHLEYDAKEFTKTFEQRANQITLEMLKNSEEQIKGEIQKYGITINAKREEEKRLPGSGGLDTLYDMSNQGAGRALQVAAGDLAKKRREVDKVREASVQSRDAVTKAKQANPFIIPEPLVTTAEKDRQTWLKSEDDYHKEAMAKNKEYPVIAMYSTGPGSADRLEALSKSSSKDVGQSIGEESRKRLTNIMVVRSDLGGRFKIWKQPHILNLTKKDMSASDWQARVVADKVKSEAEAAESSKILFTAIAVGLGLLAAIPTGGSSLLAGIAAGAATLGAAASIYGAYEELQNYTMENAAAGTAYDRAQSISQEDPSMLWLALDIVAAVADIYGAAAAFKAMRAAILAAKADKVAKLPEVIAAGRKAGLSAEAQGRVVAAVMEGANAATEVKASLETIAAVFRKLDPAKVDTKLAEAFSKAAEKIIQDGRIAVISENAIEQMAEIRKLVAAQGGSEAEIARRTKELFGDLSKPGARGVYHTKLNIIIVKGSADPVSVASVLAHELAHQRQQLVLGIKNMSLYEAEFQAFVAQREFLTMLPQQIIPKDQWWLLRASTKDIENHVLTYYPQSFKLHGFDNDMAVDAILHLLRSH